MLKPAENSHPGSIQSSPGSQSPLGANSLARNVIGTREKRATDPRGRAAIERTSSGTGGRS